MGDILDFKSGNKKTNKVNIDPNILPPVICECGSIHWNSAFVLKKVSRLISDDGQEGLIPVPDMICVKCNKPLSEIKIEV